ncbi:MAG: hypothetical protein V3W14_04520 [Candidatus Neomarinimicrobiota bacterium]
MYKHNKVLFGLAGMLLAGSMHGQTLPPANLVTIPTAGTMQRGSYEVEMLMQSGGGVLGRLGVGITDQFSLGMSYGVQQFIGDQKPSINRTMPEAQLKYRLFEESYKMPAIAFGLDTQGRGAFQSKTILDTVVTDSALGSHTVNKTTYERYEIKAIGLYLVASKNWDVLGNFGSHIGISKNLLENDEFDDDLNLFFGVDKDLSEQFSLFMEFNATLDDNNYKDNLADLENFTIGKGNGYLNAGFRWHIAPTFYMEIDFNDILINKNKVDVENISRELKVVFNDYF